MPGTRSGLEDAIALITRILADADNFVDLRFAEEAFQGRTPTKQTKKKVKKKCGRKMFLHHIININAFEREK